MTTKEFNTMTREFVEAKAEAVCEQMAKADILAGIYVELRKGGFHEQAKAFKSMCIYGFMAGKDEKTIALNFLALANK